MIEPHPASLAARKKRPFSSPGPTQNEAAVVEVVGNPVWISITYGAINATIVLPVIMSFGAIIYRDDAFAPYIPVLVKLTIISGVVHQLCFSTFSSLPFAVGQVQDAGLIFLSGMASNVVAYCRAQGRDAETMLATVTVGLSLATVLLGCGLVLVGYLRLAEHVQRLPTWFVPHPVSCPRKIPTLPIPLTLYVYFMSQIQRRWWLFGVYWMVLWNGWHRFDGWFFRRDAFDCR